MQVLAGTRMSAAFMLLAVSGCAHSDSRTTDRDEVGIRDLPKCQFHPVDTQGWVEVVDEARTVSARLPPGARVLSNTDIYASKNAWEFAAGSVSIAVEDWGPFWQDTASADFAASWPLCADSVSGYRLRIKSRFDAPHPFGEGQYLIAYLGLDRGGVLVLRAFAQDSSARDTLFTIATRLQPAR